jgi:APA family basic amino acid/polyamine antiporter
MISRMSDSPPRISPLAATAIVIASMVGTGVFTSLGFQLQDVPSGFPVLLLWTVGGIVSLCGALCYAELVAMIPRSGGEYHLVGQVYHPLAGFLAGWISMIAGFSAPVAIAAMAFGKYVSGVWPEIDDRLAAFTLVAVITVLQLAGVKWVAKFQITITVAKTLLIALFVLAAWWIGNQHWDWSLLKPKSGDQEKVLSSSFASSLFWVMYAYAGWNGAAYVAGEMRNPQRNVPLALSLGTLIVMALYLALNAVFLLGGNWSAMTGKEEVGLIAARSIFGDDAGRWMGVLIAFGLLATVNAYLWTGAATMRVIGRDLRAFCWLDAADRRGEPIGAVLFMTNFVFLLLGTGSFDALVNYVQALLQLSSLLCVAAVVWWRIRWPQRERPFRVPLYPLPPLIFIVASLWMFVSLLQRKPEESAWGTITLLIGVLIYMFSRKEAPKSADDPTTQPEMRDTL